MTEFKSATMPEIENYWKAEGDAHGYVLQGAPWGSGVRPFRALYDLGLKESDTVLDFGCGSLRVGRFLIMYLDAGRYFGIEPSAWAVRQGLAEIGNLGKLKAAAFQYPEYGVFDADLFDGQSYDWILFSGVLTHMDHSQLRSSLYSAARVLNPGGHIVGSYLPSGPDHEGTGWLYPQQAPHYKSCLQTALANTPLRIRDIDVPGDPAQWFDTWFAAS